MILAIVIFFFKSETNFPMINNKFTNYALWVPFFMGLLLDPFRVYSLNNGEEDYKIFTFVELVIITILFLIALIMGLFSSFKRGYSVFMRQVIYMIVFILTFVLLIVFRKKSNTFLSLLYSVKSKDSNKCKNVDSDRITVKTSGEYFIPNISFIVFLILIFIPMNSNSTFLNVVNGLLLGIFVGSMSFSGIEFPLRREPGDYCLTENVADCASKNIPDVTNKQLNVQTTTKKIINNLSNRVKMNTWTTMGVSLIVIIVIIIISLRVINE